jgi:hypothetical protein
VAYLNSQDQNAATEIKGIPSSFGAEAGALHLLSTTPPATELTVLLVIQTIQNLMDNELEYDSIRHT